MTHCLLSTGPKGLPGPSGLAGLPGPTLPTGFLLVEHSQRTQVPECRAGTKLWDGYSLLYLEGNERSHSQDLGTPFNSLPTKIKIILSYQVLLSTTNHTTRIYVHVPLSTTLSHMKNLVSLCKTTPLCQNLCFPDYNPIAQP